MENKPIPLDPWSKEVKTKRDPFTYNALHDSLTDLYNYSAFDILFHDWDHEHIAVLIAEIDGYDGILRKMGRKRADLVVQRAAEVLRKNFRSVDHICRLQEDEFAVIMTRITSAEKELVADKVKEMNRSLQEEKEDLLPFSLSVGAAFSDEQMPDENVFADADAALKHMKEMKQKGYAVYEPDSQERSL